MNVKSRLSFDAVILIFTVACLELWKQSNDPAHLATALYNFQAHNEQELSITVGDRLVVAPGSYQTHFAAGWVLVTVDGRKAGLVPGNRIHISGQLRSASVHLSQSDKPNKGNFNTVQRCEFLCCLHKFSSHSTVQDICNNSIVLQAKTIPIM